MTKEEFEEAKKKDQEDAMPMLDRWETAGNCFSFRKPDEKFVKKEDTPSDAK